MIRSRVLPSVVFCLLLMGTAFAQDPPAGMGHQMKMEARDSAYWRMPPMELRMPMLPGLGGALPVVQPFLPGDGVETDMFPEARPREIVEMADGDTLNLEASLVRRTLGDRTFIMYGYNRQYPGPLIRAERGSTVTVIFTNLIDLPTTIHWHGIRLDNGSDGVPYLTQDPVQIGETFTYRIHFRDPGIYWYHPHMREDVQQDLGLYGNILIDPESENYYAPANREEVIILDDILTDDSGLFPYGKEAATHALTGRFGNIMLVNGETDYKLNVEKGSVVRFFITNVANSRTFNLLFGGAPIKIVASDVSKFEHEEWVESVVIGPAERYIVDVRFPEAGSYAMTNSVQAINHFRGLFYTRIDTLGLVSVSGAAISLDLSGSYSVLRTNQDVLDDIEIFRPFFDREVDHSVEMTIEVKGLHPSIVRSMEIDTLYVPPMEWNDAMPMMNYLSSSEQVRWILRDRETGRENMDMRWVFRSGEVSKIRLFNNPKSFHPMNHPFHMHGQRFLVLSIDGTPNPNLVWKDTAIIPVGSTVDLLLDADNPGKWMAHCHIAEHLESGMMTWFEVLPARGSLEPDSLAAASPWRSMRDIRPDQYEAYRTRAPLIIDGRLDEPDWTGAEATRDFMDIEGASHTEPVQRTYVKMLWDDSFLYIGARLEETDLWATIGQKNSVMYYDNDFEVFIDPDGDNHNYHEIELNALNTLWELSLKRPYRDGGPVIDPDNISGLKTSVHLDGTLNDPSDLDTGWTVEIAVPWEELGRFDAPNIPPLPDDVWRINFSRVEWDLEAGDGTYTKVPDRPEHNWVWSPTGIVDMHRPERWGMVRFLGDSVEPRPHSGGKGGISQSVAEELIDLGTRDVLMEIYYLASIYRGLSGTYPERLEDILASSSSFQDGFEYVISGDGYLVSGPGDLFIDQHGRIWKSGQYDRKR